MNWEESKIDHDEKVDMMRGNLDEESGHPVMGIYTYSIRFTLQLASEELYPSSITN